MIPLKDYSEMTLERLLKEEHRNAINIVYAERRGDAIAVENLLKKKQKIKNEIEQRRKD